MSSSSLQQQSPYNVNNVQDERHLLQDKYSIFSTPRWPSSRRITGTTASSTSTIAAAATSSISRSSSPSFSSSSSSILDDSPPLSPSTPLPQFSGRIPFSWETHPGIPKKQLIRQSNTAESSNKTGSTTPPNSSSSRIISRSLPLPPPPTQQSRRTHRRRSSTSSGGGGGGGGTQSVRRDPFFAALVECSKEDGTKKPRATTTRPGPISDRFGLGSIVNLSAYSCKSGCVVSESMVLVPRSRRALLGYKV